MKLHTHPEEFRELITVVANEKHISESAVERDYYIVMMLKSLADSPETNCQGLFHQIHKKSTKKGARSTVWLLTPRLTDYIFPFSRSLQRYA